MAIKLPPYDLEIEKIDAIEGIMKDQNKLLENVSAIYEIVADKLINPDIGACRKS